MSLVKFLGIILAITIVLSCEEKPVPPVISTTTITEISTTSVVSGGNITDDGGAPIISKGICWNTAADPTTDNNKTVEPGESLSFTSNISQLMPGTSYFVRAYAVNRVGISYGKSVSFKTLGDKPSSISQNASSIQTTTATLNGTVNPNSFETTITFEYGISASYGNSIAAHESPLSGASEFNVTADLTDLIPGTTYHFRIKGENSLGILYSNDLTFTTLGQVPSAITRGAQIIKLTSATVNGTVNPNFLSTSVVLEWGSTTSYGNTIYFVPDNLNGHDTIALSCSISGLNPGSSYHYRITATNILGTTHGSDMIFTTYNVADIDSNYYHNITIGAQIWMTENLRSTRYNDGTPIPLLADSDLWSSTMQTEAYCWYNNDSGNKNVHGAIYNWIVVDQSYNGNKNVCPDGWHVPKKAEWSVLFNYLSLNGYGSAGNSEEIAKSLASTTGWQAVYPVPAGTVGNDQAANNTSGFNGTPSGWRSHNGTFSGFGLMGAWWAQPDDYFLGYSPWCNNIHIHMSTVTTLGLGSEYGSSVRCLKD